MLKAIIRTRSTEAIKMRLLSQEVGVTMPRDHRNFVELRMTWYMLPLSGFAGLPMYGRHEAHGCIRKLKERARGRSLN